LEFWKQQSGQAHDKERLEIILGENFVSDRVLSKTLEPRGNHMPFARMKLKRSGA